MNESEKQVIIDLFVKASICCEKADKSKFSAIGGGVGVMAVVACGGTLLPIAPALVFGPSLFRQAGAWRINDITEKFFESIGSPKLFFTTTIFAASLPCELRDEMLEQFDNDGVDEWISQFGVTNIDWLIAFVKAGAGTILED